MNDEPVPYADLDDTLADGPAPAALPDDLPASLPDEARAWLAEQRFVHGLLRALNTADASAREGRVAAILLEIDQQRVDQQRVDQHRIDAAPRPLGTRRRWVAVAAAALVLASFGLWLLATSAALPTADGAVDRAVGQLARDVDRRYRLEVVGTDSRGKERARHELLLVTRPGGRFRVDGRFRFGTTPLGEIRAGSDGHELWLTAMNGSFRHAVPVADRDRLPFGLGELLDDGYLDLHGLLRGLPEDCHLRVVGRERAANGRSLLRIQAERKQGRERVRVRNAFLLVDEATDLVTHIEAEVELGRSQRRIVLDHLGEEPPGLVDYRRPW
jgi:hypothetical protein